MKFENPQHNEQLYKEKHKVIQNVNFWFIFLVWGNFSQLFLKTRVKATISGTFRNIFDGGCYTQITEVTLTFTVVSSNGNSILSELVSASFESLRETLLTPVRIWKRACLGLGHCDILIMHLLKGGLSSDCFLNSNFWQQVTWILMIENKNQDVPMYFWSTFVL